MSLKNTRNNLIEGAAELIGVKAAGEPLAAEDLSTGDAVLNRMLKAWQHEHLWSRNDFVVFLQPAQTKYTFGGTNTDEATESYTETTLSVAAAAADTTLSLTSSTGLVAADRIGIKLDDGTVQWTTIKIAVSVTLNDAITSAATAGNAVYFYTTKIDKVLRIPDAQRVQGTGTTLSEIEMISLSRSDYRKLPSKNSSGTPVNYFYDPKVSTGELFVWPAPTSTDTYLNCTGIFPLGIFSDADDTPDLPEEWLEAIEYNLAVRMAPRFEGVEVSPYVAVMAVSSLEEAKNWDQGDSSIFFQVA